MKSRRAHNIAATRRAGLTLIEVTVSIAMFSIVALALGSALTLASKALPDAKSANPSLLSATKVHDQIASELFYAQSVTEMTPNAITFTVADRNADATPETIRYAWTGVAGDPLTRSYNGGAAMTVLSDCREFALTFDKRAVKSPATYTEQAEQQIYNSGKGLLGGDYSIDSSDFCGETMITPSWSANVAFWRITRLTVSAKQNGAVGGENFRAQVRAQDASGLPTGTLYQSVTVMESTLPSGYGNLSIAFPASAQIPPTQDVCIIFRHIRGGSSGILWTNNLSLALNGNLKLLTTGNGGSTWSGNTLRALAMTVWAAPSTKDADAYQYFLTNVRASIRSGADTTARVAGVFNLPTQPQVTGP